MSTWYFNSAIFPYLYPVSRLYVLFILACLLFPLRSKAQHCPFDGGNIVVVQLIDSKGNPLRIEPGELKLQEINNPSPDSCSFAGSLLSLAFSPVEQTLAKHYDKYIGLLKTNCADCSYLGEGYYAVVLNMAQETCMVKKGNDYTYIPRKFEVRYTAKDREKAISVPPNQIYSLCTNGKWSRIIPIAVPL